MQMKFDFDDILIQPGVITRIDHRAQINIFDQDNMLPLFTAPMDTVVNSENAHIFTNNKIRVILPRTENSKRINNGNVYSEDFSIWMSYSLEEFDQFFLKQDALIYHQAFALIDVANGHMPSIRNAIINAKYKYGHDLQLMVGNIANPETYRELSLCGADYIRIGIGNGSGCLTSVQLKLGYPLASLIAECYEIAKTLEKPAKIVADGGIKKYGDIIAALALGADYVMIGSVFNKALESAGDTFRANIKHESWTEPGELVNQYDPITKQLFLNGTRFFKKFRGMSTKEVQKTLGNKVIKTSEGIVKMQPVEYTLSGWVENFEDYLKSVMSYTDSLNLSEFIGKVKYNLISQNAFNRFNK